MSAESSSTPSRLIPRKYIIGGVIAALLLGTLMVLGISWLSRGFAVQLDVVRDLFIIAIALEACVFGFVLVILLVMVVRLVNTLEFEIKPILQKANEITTTAKGTTEFVSENIVQPTIKARGYVSGVRAGAKALIGDPKKNLPK
jgi:hypothetical protein